MHGTSDKADLTNKQRMAVIKGDFSIGNVKNSPKRRDDVSQSSASPSPGLSVGRNSDILRVKSKAAAAKDRESARNAISAAPLDVTNAPSSTTDCVDGSKRIQQPFADDSENNNNNNESSENMNLSSGNISGYETAESAGELGKKKDKDRRRRQRSKKDSKDKKQRSKSTESTSNGKKRSEKRSSLTKKSSSKKPPSLSSLDRSSGSLNHSSSRLRSQSQKSYGGTTRRKKRSSIQSHGTVSSSDGDTFEDVLPGEKKEDAGAPEKPSSFRAKHSSSSSKTETPRRREVGKKQPRRRIKAAPLSPKRDNTQRADVTGTPRSQASGFELTLMNNDGDISPLTIATKSVAGLPHDKGLPF